MKSVFLEIIFCGGVNFEDGVKYCLLEFDMFIFVEEIILFLFFGQFGFCDYDSSSFDGCIYVNVGVGYCQEVNGWLFGVNMFLDVDICYFYLCGGIGGEVYKDSLVFFGNYYFFFIGWKMLVVYELYDECLVYGFDL